jgi:heptaprenyl diphosphate synthase
MVFQIRDDVFDIVASEAELGKPPGQDLAEGIYTLPVQRALADRRVGPELRDLLGRPLDADEVSTARALVASSSGIADAALVARSFTKQAREAATNLGDHPVVRALSRFVTGLLDDLERSTEALVL